MPEPTDVTPGAEKDRIAAMSPDERCDYYTLPEQRIKLEVRSGGRGATHVVKWSTFPATAWPGRWTRRAADRVALRVGADDVVHQQCPPRAVAQ